MGVNATAFHLKIFEQKQNGDDEKGLHFDDLSNVLTRQMDSSAWLIFRALDYVLSRVHLYECT